MFNCHCHTDLSYCSEGGMTLDFIAEVIRQEPELDGVAITDHSFAIYFPEGLAWSFDYMLDSKLFDENRDRGNAILEPHLQEIRKREVDHLVPGIEVEMMHDGRFTVDPDLLKEIPLIIGSIHWLGIAFDSKTGEITNIWRQHTLDLLEKDIQILGHPFRWLSNRVPDISPALIKEIVSAAASNGVALEFNSHYEIDTDVQMIREIAEQGAQIAFSTDAHRQAEIADFSYHKRILQQAGVNLSDLNVFFPES